MIYNLLCYLLLVVAIPLCEYISRNEKFGPHRRIAVYIWNTFMFLYCLYSMFIIIDRYLNQ